MNPKYHIDKRALFCDETTEYRFPAEPECNQEVTIRFRTAKDNVDQVYLIYSNTEVKMEKVETAGRFDYYQTKLTVKNNSLTEVIKSKPIQKFLEYIEKNQIKGCPASRRK